MNNILRYSLFVLMAVVGSFYISAPAFAQSNQNNGNKKTLDRIIAVVNDHSILKSEVDQQVADYLLQLRRNSPQREVEFSKDLWYSVLQNIVERYVLLDKAREDSVTISDDQVDQRINQRIDQVVQQLGSEQAVEQRMGKSIVQLRADLRQSYREEMIVQKYRQQEMQNIRITRPEVKDYFERIPQDSLPTVPEQVAVSQIVKIPPPLEDAEKEARQLAEQLRDSVINHGKSIEELARRHSDGPSAGDGGELGMIPIGDFVPEYSAAASALQPGEISEVVKTSFGYHVIRLNKRVGDEIDTNHILISVDQESYDTQVAIDALNAIRDSVLTNPDITFAEMARKHSEDPQTAPQGGRLMDPQTGNRLIPLSRLDPAMYRIVLLLEEEGQISEPKQFNTGSGNNAQTAYRIVRLDRRVPEHRANLEQDYEQIKNIALQQKQYRFMRNWIDNLREEVYIEYKIPVPEQFAQQTQ
ncbi:peptidylprolyl isomerase [Aliifodinibius sp. S!AR15-10]|uniref:peptidylprolyl isomerase n=1 Tax=Aliifodinibius sp. S!AR15-10 TaxID=2950437 RepID=UPI00285A3D23|nr:peptidylprolyl isomerase [Aliifodinibius sp. S!AR15-10]MDR8391581.1 peptidylprolyl isomerase [Aliifodinibius sp. S!AR15-10]